MLPLAISRPIRKTMYVLFSLVNPFSRKLDGFARTCQWLQDGAPKFLSGIIKGLRSSNEQKVDQVQDFSHLGNIFSNPPYLKPSATGGDDELNIGL